MMHKLLILSRHRARYEALVDAASLPDLAIFSTSDPAEASIRGTDCDLALGEPSPLSQVIMRLTALRWVQSTWAGVEPLLDRSLRHDYLLSNACGVFGELMVEYVFGYLLAHERRILARFAAQQEGRWDSTPPGSLRGRRMGLIGVGSIGAALARTAKHFGMQVKGYTRTSETCADVDAYFHGEGLHAFASDLDYLVSVAPSTSGTRRIVDAALLQALPRHAVFINPGRGDVVDEAALAAALRAGQMGGAVLDVFQQEPLPPDHVFWRTPNLLITAHTAALSVPEDIAALFVRNYRRFTSGEPIECRVDFERGY
jgi:phosphoglycerate dehydrogenase-like enzyme